MKEALTTPSSGAILCPTLADSLFFANPSQAALAQTAVVTSAQFAAGRASHDSLPKSNPQQSTHPYPMEE
jgi:hypothetical protein